MILNHSGMPHDAGPAGVADWRDGMRTLTACDNLAVKISGLGMMNDHWTIDTIRPFVLDALEIFGTDRACLASNFLLDGLFSSFVDLWQAFVDITAGASPDDQDGLFRTTAETLYWRGQGYRSRRDPPVCRAAKADGRLHQLFGQLL